MRTLVLASLVLVGGCLAEESDTLSQTQSDITSSNRISSNRISSNRISSNRISSNGLIFADQDSGSLINDEGGRELLQYMIGCALPTGQHVTLTDTAGTDYTFDGSIGLAPSWYANPATPSDRRWVSACLLARTNYYGTSVPISLRGNHPALATDATEQAAFSLREGAFWGDLFTPTAPLVACTGPAKLAGSHASSLDLRQCTRSDDGVKTWCSFDYAGPCDTACTLTDGLSGSCGPSAANEVITVYLQTPGN